MEWRTRRQVLAAFVLAGLVGGNSVAQGLDPAAAKVVWHCWYDGKVTAFCDLGRVDDSADESAAGPVSSRLPEIVHTIAKKPARMRGNRVAIPLYSIPFDMASVRELATSVMCGLRRDCAVRFGTASMVAAWQLEED